MHEDINAQIHTRIYSSKQASKLASTQHTLHSTIHIPTVSPSPTDSVMELRFNTGHIIASSAVNTSKALRS